MTKASDNAYPSILITEGTEPSAPAAGKQRLYIDSTTHKLKRTDSSGTDVTIESTGGSVATDAIFDAKGDLAVGTGADTASKLTVGANQTIPIANSAQSTGIEWVALASGRVVRTSGDVTLTGSTSWTDVTGASITITTGARKCLVGLVAVGYVNNTAGTGGVDLDIDGTRVGDSTIGLVTLQQHSTASEAMNYSFVHMTAALTAASHTFKIQMKVFNAAHTMTIQGGAAGASTPYVFWVAEIPG